MKGELVIVFAKSLVEWQARPSNTEEALEGFAFDWEMVYFCRLWLANIRLTERGFR